MNTPFGVIIGCCKRDICYTKGCVASVRRFMGDVPICLLIDGDFDVADLVAAYGVQTLFRREVKNDFLRANSFGYGLTKMVALWESPFDRFLFLDADTVVWGDLQSKLALDDTWDLHIDRPREAFNERNTTKYFFDTAKLHAIYPDYQWQSHAGDYFCTGVWAAKRGVFRIEDYVAILNIHHQNKHLFKSGEMGFFNFMIMRAMDSGAAKVRRTEMQTIVCDFPLELLKERYGITHLPDELAGRCEPTVLHYTHPKPFVRNGEWSAPMTYFRRQWAARQGAIGRAIYNWHLHLEDFHFEWPLICYRQGWRFGRLISYCKRRLGLPAKVYP